MKRNAVHISPDKLARRGLAEVPAAIAAAGPKTTECFLEFFTATIRNRNTRMAYGRALSRFLAWADGHGLELQAIRPTHVAAFIEGHPGAPASVKQALAAIRSCFDYLTVHGHVEVNPAAPVKGPSHSARRGKTPALSARDVGRLLASIPTDTVAGLRDRALIAVLFFTTARVSAVCGLTRGDFLVNGNRRHWLRLSEKRGKVHEVPCHHVLEEALWHYVDAADLDGAVDNAPLFPSLRDSERALTRQELAAMLRRRAKAAGIAARVTPHVFRASGITAALESGQSIEAVQDLAGHADARTTRLYDRRKDRDMISVVESIQLE